MSSIPVDVLLFTCAWKKRKQMILIALRNTHFCLQVGFFFSSAMCIVCFHFWIGSLTFVPVKESGTNNTQTRVFEHSTIKSSPSSYPSNTQSAAIFLQGKTKWCLITERNFIVPLSQILTFVRTPWEIYFARQKTSNISGNFFMAWLHEANCSHDIGTDGLT